MYRWEWPHLFVPKLFLLYGTLNNFFFLYCSLGVLEFNSSAGLFYFLSSDPLRDDEERWLTASFVVLVGQLSVLMYMWRSFQQRLSKNAKLTVDLAAVMELLPYWGLIRGSYSLYTYGLSRRRILTSLVILAAAAAFTLCLLHWRGMHASRLITLIHALIYVDAWSCLFAQGGQSAPELIPPILTGVKSTPHNGLATLVYLGSHTIFMFRRLEYLLVLMPSLSAALLMRFILVPYAPRYIAKPIPLPPSAEKPQRPFCQVCQDTVVKGLKRGREKSSLMDSYPHQPTLKSLKRSATEGCRICSTVWEKMCTAQWDWGVSLLLFTKHATSWASFAMGAVTMHSKWEGNLCNFGTIDAKKYDFRSRPEPDLQDHTGSYNSLNLAKEWLSKCVLDHPACREGKDLGFRPSRLLYIADGNHVRLDTTADYPSTLGYMTLSHCWGGAQFIQLKQSNINAFREEIPWDSLPQTFKDAIRVARHLGAKYLWIDSLCIIQDSKQDWLTESKVMGNIYKNSVCNIAASDARNSLEGCLYPRNHRTVQPERLSSSTADASEEQELYFINTPGVAKRSDRVYSRAWVFQESILARRTLDCARDQLFWRCDERVASEEFSGGLSGTDLLFNNICHPSRHIMGTQNDVSSLQIMVKEMEAWMDRNQDVLQMSGPRGQNAAFLSAQYSRSCPGGYWASIVEIYSRMSITHDTDRPIALSGVVDSFRPFLGEYWAGMWQDLLPGHLAWSIREFSAMQSRIRSSCHRQSTQRAPTWSWLSLEGAIHYREMGEFHRAYGDEGDNHPGDAVLAQLLDVEVLSSQDIRLHMRAPLVHAEWAGGPTDILTLALEAAGLKYVTPGLSIVDMDEVARWKVSSGIQSCMNSEVSITLVFDVAEEEKEARDVHLVAIRTRFQNVEGLVLQQRDDGGVFTRVGRFTAWQPADRPFIEGNQTDFVLA